MLIIFDLDDTLIDTTGSVTPIQLENALLQMMSEGLEVGNFEAAITMLKRMDSSSESALHTLKEFLDLIDAPQEFLQIGQKAIYGKIPEEISIFALEEAESVLEYLKARHQIALVSKGKSDQQLFKLKNAGLDSGIFSKIVFSEDEDKKPSYEKVLQELNVTADKTVVCGDRIGRDLSPAKQLGCWTVQMLWGRGLSSKGAASDVDFKIRRLNQLLEIIDKL
ncbi:MAG: HAD family hydrolase [Candidatus Rhabdochlamydia sp.]